MIYEAIRTRLLTDSTITGMVDQRVFRLRARQGTQRPFITIQQISSVPATTLLGDAGTYFARYQVNIIHDDAAECATLAAAVKARLSGWQEVGGSEIRSDLLNEIDTIESTPGNESGVNRIQQDYEIDYAEQ